MSKKNKIQFIVIAEFVFTAQKKCINFFNSGRRGRRMMLAKAVFILYISLKSMIVQPN